MGCSTKEKTRNNTKKIEVTDETFNIFPPEKNIASSTN